MIHDKDKKPSFEIDIASEIDLFIAENNIEDEFSDEIDHLEKQFKELRGDDKWENLNLKKQQTLLMK